MDTQAFIQAISTVGFPIAAYAAMFWYMIQQNNAHKEEMNANTRALMDLREVIAELKEHLIREDS